MRRVLLTALFLLSANLAVAQEIRLTNRFVVDVAIDSKDRVWVATDEGLNCYDGIGNRGFLKQPDGMPSNQLNCLLVDRDDPLIWVATQKAGIACYDTRTEQFSVYRAGDTPDALPDDDISHIEQAPDGAVWASTFSKGLVRLDKGTGTFERYNTNTFEGMRDVPLHTFRFRGDQLVLGYWAGGISILSLTDHSHIDLRHNPEDPLSLPSDEVRALLVDSHNRIWVGTTEGLALYSEAARGFTVFRHRDNRPFSLPEGTVYDLAEDAQGRLLVATSSGSVLVLDVSRTDTVSPESPFVPIYPYDYSPAYPARPQVRSLTSDRFGNLWIGTYGGGLQFLSGQMAGAGRQLFYQRDPDSREARALFLGSDGHLIVGSRAGLVDLSEIWSNRMLFGQARDTGPVNSLIQDAEGRWWVGTEENGLFLMERQRSRTVDLAADVTAVRALLADGASLWVGTERGLYRIERSSCRVTGHWTRRDNGMPDDVVRALCKDAEGRLWIGFFGHGLAVYDPGMNELARYDVSSGLLSDTVNHLFCDGGGRMWVGTPAGLVRFDEGPDMISAVFTAADGLPNENIRALTEDSEGNLWMSTNGGVACLLTDGRMRFFDHRDALPDGNYFNAAVARSWQGILLFGSTDGVGWVDPERLLKHITLPPVSFLTPSAELSTDHRNNHLHVRFCMPDHAYAQRVEYAYRLLEWDAEWHTCGTELDFHQLPYGHVTLQVRARVHSQDWTDDIASVSLYVRPPFWRTWWAWVLYILFAVALIGAATVYQNRQVARRNAEKLQQDRLLQEREVNEERMLFYTNVTHELRTPLTLIMGPLEDLSEDETLPSRARTRLGKVGQSAHQLMGLVNQLLEFSKTETRNRRLSVRYADLSGCVEEVGARFRDLSTNRAVEFVIAVEPDIRLLFDAGAITIILNNLLSNAQKYTASGKIVLSLQREGDRVALSVSDTGCGIGSADLDHIFERYFQVKGPHQASGTGIGLALVRSLCDLHHIDLQVSSEQGQGTEFRLLLDPSEQYPEALHPLEQEVPAEEQTPPVEPVSATGISILVVEDNAEIRNYIQESLSPGFVVLEAADGRAGLKLAVREVPGIIVSDIMMPEMDGIAMCKALRQDVRTSHIPVILLTAKGSDKDRIEGYDVGADSYLVKPFDRSLLLSRIRNLLERRKRVMTEVSESGMASELSAVDNAFLKRFTQFVEEHLADENVDIALLSEQFAISQSTLYRKVKAVSGLSPNELIRNIRLNKAAELLLSPELTISEIAWRTGFGSPVYFRTCFKERFGRTPSEYRERKASRGE